MTTRLQEMKLLRSNLSPSPPIGQKILNSPIPSGSGDALRSTMLSPLKSPNSKVPNMLLSSLAVGQSFRSPTMSPQLQHPADIIPHHHLYQPPQQALLDQRTKFSLNTTLYNPKGGKQILSNQQATVNKVVNMSATMYNGGGPGSTKRSS